MRPAKSEVSRLLSDSSKAERLAGWRAETSLDDGLRRTAAWIGEHLDLYRPQGVRRMKAVILAGGKGVRLRPLTYTIPKPLLPVGEKPILEEIIERLQPFGVRRIHHRRGISRGADRDVLPRRLAARRAYRLRARDARAGHSGPAAACPRSSFELPRQSRCL